MNCDVNYEDPQEEEESESVPTRKTVSWKSIVSTTFKTPQECVEQNSNPGLFWRSDTRNPRGNPRGNLGVARLGALKRLAGARKKREARE